MAGGGLGAPRRQGREAAGERRCGLRLSRVIRGRWPASKFTGFFLFPFLSFFNSLFPVFFPAL